MKKISIAFIILLFVAAFTYELVFKNTWEKLESKASPPQSQSSLSSQTGSSVSNAQKAEVSIDIKWFSFNPKTITVKKGTKITWTNHDSAPHNVISDTGESLKSPTLNTGDSYTFTFQNEGTYFYHCGFHRMMKAQVIVEK